MRTLRNTVESFLDQTENVDGCWVWRGSVSPEGYVRRGFDGRLRLIHRVVYEHFVGPIPEGMVLDHTCHTSDPGCLGGPLCRHRRCLNPKHLAVVTNSENTMRGRGFAPANVAKTHCTHGHRFTPDNTYVGVSRNGKRCRRCMACRRDQRARYRNARNAARASGGLQSP